MTEHHNNFLHLALDKYKHEELMLMIKARSTNWLVTTEPDGRVISPDWKDSRKIYLELLFAIGGNLTPNNNTEKALQFIQQYQLRFANTVEDILFCYMYQQYLNLFQLSNDELNIFRQFEARRIRVCEYLKSDAFIKGHKIKTNQKDLV